MNDAYVIEIESLFASVVQCERRGFRFYAPRAELRGPDGQHFATPWRAQHAAEELARSRAVQRQRQILAWTGQLHPMPAPQAAMLELDWAAD